MYEEKKKYFVDKLKLWVSKMEECEKGKNANDKTIDKIKMSNIISLEIVKSGRPFTDGEFMKSIFINILQNLNLELATIMESVTLSHQTVARRIHHIGLSIKLQIKNKLN